MPPESPSANFVHKRRAARINEWLDKLPPITQSYLAGRYPEEIECIIADFPGCSRGKAMPGSKFAAQSGFYLPKSIFYQTITGSWVVNSNKDTQIESDMLLQPDFSTAAPVPWNKEFSLQIIHDSYDRAGNPISISPRNVLKRVLSLYHREGWQPIVAPELEFYLVKRSTDSSKPLEAMLGRTGRPSAQRQAYSMAAVDEYGKIVDDIYIFAEAQGFEIDGITQEGGAGQLEINLQHGKPLALADEVFYFKRLIREAALNHDCFATFMAKPIEGEPGSAMHLHHSILDINTQQNIFCDPLTKKPTDAFFHYIAGMQRYIPSVLSILAPYVNSFRRFVRNYAAPINLSWSYDNRTAGIRIPASSPENLRVENRITGMDCNPYLAIAASLACGYLGLKEAQHPADQSLGNAYEQAPDLPTNPSVALDLFVNTPKIKEILGEDFVNSWSQVKATEYEEFLQVISPWEREHLLMAV